MFIKKYEIFSLAVLKANKKINKWKNKRNEEEYKIMKEEWQIKGELVTAVEWGRCLIWELRQCESS